jgi:alpha-N-acetylglucosamine transferase
MLIPIGMAECLESGGLRRQFMANSRMNKERAVNGIVMIALEDPAYAAAAFNLALSIKHFNPFLDITLLTDSTHQRCYRNEHYSVFDRIAEISSEDYTNDGRFCPGKAKLALYKYSAYKYSLYLDADSICFKNLDALFKQLNGHAFKSQRLRNYTQWTDAETFKSFFGSISRMTRYSDRPRNTMQEVFRLGSWIRNGAQACPMSCSSMRRLKS